MGRPPHVQLVRRWLLAGCAATLGLLAPVLVPAVGPRPHPLAPGVSAREPNVPAIAFARRDVILAPDVTFARAADMDNDGDPDFVTLEPETDDLSWWENESAGTSFTEHVFSPSYAAAEVVAPADVNADGFMDVLVLAPERRRLAVFLGSASGDLTEETGFTMQTATYVEGADVNGDGLDDFFSDSPVTGLEWWENQSGQGEIRFESHSIAGRPDALGEVVRLDAGDLDGDGDVDFATANTAGERANWWLQTTASPGEIQFERQSLPGLREPQIADVAIGDADGDGNADLFTLRMAPYRVFLWRRESPTSFRKETGDLAESPDSDTKPWMSLDAADVDGDGDMDFLVSEPGGRLCWYQNPAGILPTQTVTLTVPVTTDTATAQATEPTVTATAATAEPTVTATATATPSATIDTQPSATPTDRYRLTDTPTATELYRATSTSTTDPTVVRRIHMPYTANRG
jgi:hypothetical protein